MEVAGTTELLPPPERKTGWGEQEQEEKTLVSNWTACRPRKGRKERPTPRVHRQDLADLNDRKGELNWKKPNSRDRNNKNNKGGGRGEQLP